MNKKNETKNGEMYIPDRPIAFNRDFVYLGVGITGALMLSQAVYWSKRAKKRIINGVKLEEGEFSKTQKEWEEETGLTIEEQKTAIRRLKKIKVLVVKKKGLPARNCFKINSERLFQLLVSVNATIQSGEIPLTGEGKSPSHSITENTTENTTYYAKASFAKKNNLIKDKKISKKIKKKEKNNNDKDDMLIPFDEKKEIRKMENDKRKHIRIIAWYLKEKRVNIPSKRALNAEIKRFVRDAVILSDYPKQKIIKTKNIVKRKFPDDWKLSTILKYINYN